MWGDGSPVSATSRAVAVSAEIGRIAARGDRQAGKAGEQRAADDAGEDEEPEAVDGRVDVGDAAAVLDVAGDECAADDLGRVYPHSFVSREAGGEAAHVDGAVAFFHQVAVEVEDPGARAVGADEVVEVAVPA